LGPARPAASSAFISATGTSRLPLASFFFGIVGTLPVGLRIVPEEACEGNNANGVDPLRSFAAKEAGFRWFRGPLLPLPRCRLGGPACHLYARHPSCAPRGIRTPTPD
jgi:hypothetical protein